MSVGIRGKTSGNEVEVNDNDQLEVHTPSAADEAGFVAMAAEVDDGSVFASRTVRELDASDDYRLRVGTDRPLLQVSFEGTTIPQGHVLQATSTLQIAQTGGYLTLNSSGLTTNGASAQWRTYRCFPFTGSYPLYIEFGFRTTNETLANKTIEVGNFQCSGTSAPTDGVFLRWNAAGELRGGVSYNGTETLTAALASPTTATEHHGLIVVTSDRVEFWVDQVLLGVIEQPSAQPLPFSAAAQPFSARVYNAGSSPSAAPTLSIGWVTVSQGDMASDWPFTHVLAGMGQGAYQSFPGAASGQNANYVNSTAPASASLSNSGAGYGTVGGQFQFAAVAGAETDYALFAYQVPAPAATYGAKSLYVNGVYIDSMNTGAAVATTETWLQWAIAVGSSAVNLATNDAANTKAPRRVALGNQVFAIADPIGKQAVPINRVFQVPLVVDPGLYLHIILRMPRGTATGSQIIRGLVAVDAYYA